MAFENPVRRWSELERIASGRPPAGSPDEPATAEAPQSRKREGYRPPQDLRVRAESEEPEPRVPYAELHLHSYHSFLDGVSSPEALVEEAVRLDLDAVILSDHDGMYGAVRFAEAAREVGIRAGHGAELSLGLPGPRGGIPDPLGEHLLAVARDLEGYRRLCRVISHAQLAGGEKGRPVYDPGMVVEELRGHVLVLTGCRKGAVRRALVEAGPAAAAMALRELVDRFGREHVVVELIHHMQPLDGRHNDALAGMAADLGVPTVASNNVHYATPAQRHHAHAVAAVRARRSIADLQGWLPGGGPAFLRSGAEQAQLFARHPGAVQRAALLGVECAFDLALVAPRLPPFPTPPGFADEAAYLRHLVELGATDRYGPRAANPTAYAQLDHELRIIEELDFPGYFLVVWDIVKYCRDNNIYAQGRGSAANSAVCYALYICHADPVRWNLLFERFFSPERDGPPDIDVDIESDRREEVIQYVYATHGRFHAAQVANVITYRGRSAVRDAAKALGYTPGQQDAFGKQVDHWGSVVGAAESDHTIPGPVLDLAAQLEDTPRHLGVHSGGMVIAHSPVSEIVPVEWATAKDRSVLQWDKDDCASIGLVKFDLLGLGMLSALHYMTDLVAEHHGIDVDMGQLDLADPAVYDMLCEADAVGVFQVESRAQLATLPRLRPREFYDLVVEVALIRPGPIQGGSVHPYIRRRRGEEAWEHAHPLLAPALERTLGVPLFQEQVMQLARDVASFTAAEADQLRRAMGAKRSTAKMARLAGRFFEGASANGIAGGLADTIYEQIRAFSGYGFPESHSMSFALLVYASAYFKKYYPAAFCAGLLRAQPMGFYSPQSLVQDARRHGVTARRPDINASLPHATLEPDPASRGGQAIRLGLAAIATVGQDVAEQIVTERQARGAFTGVSDLTDRVELTTPVAEALASAGAFDVFGLDRRQALWAAGAAVRTRTGHLPGTAVGQQAPPLPSMSALELTVSDRNATGITTDVHPVAYVRSVFDTYGATTTRDLLTLTENTRVHVGGTITHRQRPGTAGGITFLNLEDETGMVNIVCAKGFYRRYEKLLRHARIVIIRGLARIGEGTVSIDADKIIPIDLTALAAPSRDFR
ncbi:error-prone DNA polymerase [Amycolatopsis sp. NBC_01480]|uniref:error-prone DNA polymerase n=1 Tax=Amycolatopsis sp. NBC_01480 TaxID=2903562 RepID=UPI002E29C5BA|nr:error-prone DNA polymerase [Amycolatopsis sp. NBC_01480]